MKKLDNVIDARPVLNRPGKVFAVLVRERGRAGSVPVDAAVAVSADGRRTLTVAPRGSGQEGMAPCDGLTVLGERDLPEAARVQVGGRLSWGLAPAQVNPGKKTITFTFDSLGF